ncbi:MAG: homoserine dehydrogenase [Bacteroidetes bacterium]|nr:homoserine dehydrogenase [Bacteroidota bacterium]
MKQQKEFRIGLFGFGCVGYGLYQVLQKTPGLKADIVKICVKQPNIPRPIPEENFCYDKYQILDDDTLDIIVELIDDADAAYDIVKYALKKGKSVVTANKKMVAEHFAEFVQLQQEFNATLLYEASCCASIPIIRNLEEYYDNDMLQSIEGIVNGSTNYILTKTATENLSYANALKEAQELGYAESNPLLDTGGFDAKYKLLILLAHAFGVVSEPKDILNVGINRLGDLELQYAREKGLKIKLVAGAWKDENDSIAAWVAPRFVKPGEKLFDVDGIYNGVITHTAFAENQFFVGKGAGAYPTASAVLSDISALTYQYKYEYKKMNQNQNNILKEDVSVKILLRHEKGQEDELRGYFTHIDESFLNQTHGYIIGNTVLSGLRELSALENISVVLF